MASYLDANNIPTIGYGHTGPNVKLGDKCSLEQATAYLTDDICSCAVRISALIQPSTLSSLSQAQFDALVSFAYNVGMGRFQRSTLLKRLNAGDKKGAAQEFLKWNEAAGRALDGLTRRRKAEFAMFTGETNDGTNR